MSLIGKVALVTGASRGIGRECALALAREGAKVFGTYSHSEGPALELSKLADFEGLSIRMLKADSAVESEINAAVRTVREEGGGLNILVNNAGIMSSSLLLMTTTDDLRRTLDVNCAGPYLYLKAASKAMMRQKSGSIVNVASVLGIEGAPGQVAYSASKAFIIGMTKAAAKELGPLGIRVNAVAPGFIDTDMTSSLSEEVKRRNIASITLGRMGTPKEIAAAVLFLASDRSSYVNGHVLRVDGGQVV